MHSPSQPIVTPGPRRAARWGASAQFELDVSFLEALESSTSSKAPAKPTAAAAAANTNAAVRPKGIVAAVPVSKPVDAEAAKAMDNKLKASNIQALDAQLAARLRVRRRVAGRTPD